MTDYPRVRVTNAPGYEDFEGVLVLACTPDWPVQKHIVGFEIDGVRDVAVVPVVCVAPINESDPDSTRSCGCGGIGIHGVDHPE
jgi:hypothetical protein